MDLAGEYRIAASREAVWEALNDPEILKECIPGCKSLEKGENGELTATVVSKVGPVKATFKGEVRLENLNPPESYSIVGEGKGGVAGFAKGGADVKLTEDGDETVLAYEARAQVGGKIAQLGSRLIDSTAKKMANDFFGAFSAKVASNAAASEADAPAAIAPEAAVATKATGPEQPAQEAPSENSGSETADAGSEKVVARDDPKPPAPASPVPASPVPASSAPAPTPSTDADENKGLSFSGPMLWLLVGAAGLILILAIAY